MPALVAEWDAIATVIRTGANPPDGLTPDRFYHDGDVPPDAVLDYLLFGQDSEGNAGFHNRPGDSTTLRVHCWARTKMHAGRLYEWFHGLVNDQRLTISGHTPWRCQVRRLPGGSGPEGKDYQVIAEVAMETTQG